MLDIISKIFGKIVEVRNKNYDSGKYNVTRSSVPVISVGNLSAGGTGKTPFVIMLANELLERGIRPSVVGKGYKRKSKGLTVVSDGKNILSNVGESGDEMLLIAASVPVPVVVHEDKAAAAQYAEKSFNIDCIIVDDGFQHRSLGRDVDIVLIDRETINSPELIPKGRLREPFDSLKRADVIVLSGIDNFQQKDLEIEGKFIIKASGKLDGLYDLKCNTVLSRDEMNEVARESSLALSGIAKPLNFLNMLKQSSFNIVHSISKSDHHQYSLQDMKNIMRIAHNEAFSQVITTEKDAVKLFPYINVLKKENIRTYYVRYTLEITNNKEEFFQYIIKKLGNRE